MKRALKRICTLLMALCLILNMGLVAGATETAEVNNAKSGVLQIKAYFSLIEGKDSNGNNILSSDTSMNFYSSGTGFLINENTLITNAHVVDTEMVLENYFTNASSLVNDYEVTIKVVIKNDVEISATVLNYSKEVDFAIITLEQSIVGKTPLTLASDEYLDSIQTATNVYALGFPSRMDYIVAGSGDATEDSIYVTSGTITSITNTVNEGRVVPVFVNSATLTGGNSGGPLVDSSGVVIGINSWGVTTAGVTDYMSVRISEVTEIMDALGIEYTSTSSTAVTVTPEPEVVVTEAPVVVTEAPVVVTEEPVVVVEESDNTMLMIGGAVVVLVVLIAVFFVMKSKKNQAPASNFNTAASRPVEAAPQSYAPQYRPQDEGTTTLGEGAGGTTVLGSSLGTIVRTKTGEEVSINVPYFTIGKEKGRVTYAVTDNSAISRVHVTIFEKDGSVYIRDMGTTNGTIVNGTKLVENKEYPLLKNSQITMGDEKFTFK